jgi:hypothetical protein
VGTAGAFEILTIDLSQKRIGVALVQEGTSRAAEVTSQQVELHDDAPQPDAAPMVSLGVLADKLRGALRGRE